MTQRKYATHLQLTRHPGFGVSAVAGWDVDGMDWTGIDATHTATRCARCGERIQYGYAPMVNADGRAHCTDCVVFTDKEATND